MAYAAGPEVSAAIPEQSDRPPRIVDEVGVGSSRTKRAAGGAGGVAVLLCAVLTAPALAADTSPVPSPSPGAPVASQGVADPVAPVAPVAPVPPVAPIDPLGSGAGESLLRLYDVVKVTAGYVAATRLEPGGGSARPGRDSAWRPPADLQTPPVTSGTAAGPGRKMTKYDVLGAAYQKAADALADGCHLPFAVLMAIGEVESGSLRGRTLDARDNVVPPVIGPALTGSGFAAIRDSDRGRLDGDPVWDRAVGPMQFIPGTWRLWGADGNGDGVADPQNVEDAALSAGRYLCAGGRDLARRADLERAILSYNHSRRYLETVLDLYDSVMGGAVAGP